MSRNSYGISRLQLAKLLWGWRPHFTQERWLINNAQTKIAACGRRWGKTEAAAVDAAAFAILEFGSTQMIVSPTSDQSRLIFDTVERVMARSPFTKHITKVTRTPYPKLTIARSVITARTADDDGRNLRGNSADRVIVDEAAYVKESVIQEVISPMLADKNGLLVMLSTPFGKNHFYRAFLKGQGQNENRYKSFSFPSVLNPFISKEYIEEQQKYMSERQFAVEYEAKFIDDQSCIFMWDDLSAAVDYPMKTSSDAYIVAGIDWARYSDFTAIIAVAINESGCKVIDIDRFNGLGWNDQLNRVINFIRKNKINSVLTDQTSIGDPLLEQLRNKINKESINVSVNGYTFTNQSKRELVENLSMLFSQNNISIPRDERLISELQYFEYELTESGNVKMNARSGYHDDLVMALALACMQAKLSPVTKLPCFSIPRKQIKSGW